MTLKSTSMLAALRAHWREPRKRRIALAVLAALVIGTLAMKSLSRGTPPAEPPKSQVEHNRLTLAEDAAQIAFLKVAPAVATAMPASDPMNAHLTLADDLTARIFPPLAGRVVTLNAAIGDTVKAGATLAVIDSPDFGQALSDLRKAQAEREQKQKALGRAKVLFEGEAMARREFESSEADARIAEAEAERARLRVANLSSELVRQDGQRLTLRAPLAGVVVDRQANPGTEVRPDAQNPLFVISDIRKLWLNIDLPEKSAELARPGAVASFTVDAYPGKEFTGRVERVGVSVDAATRRIPVRVVVDNADGRLKPEMYARAALLSPDQAKAVRVPVAALLTSGLRAQLFVQVGPREFERRNVRIARQDAEYAYLSPDSAVKESDEIVVRGALLLASEMAQGD